MQLMGKDTSQPNAEMEFAAKGNWSRWRYN